MHKLYEKSKIWFAVVWIILYVVLTSIAENIDKSVTFVLHVVMSITLIFWLKKQDLFKEFGLQVSSKKAKNFLYFIPLILLSSVNLFVGFSMEISPWKMIFSIGSMLCVGFLEELIFRGLLFKAMAEDSVKWAIAVSSITFGIGHVINLLNGADLMPTICQIFEAMAFGYLFVIIFYRGKTLLPCIISHSFINATSVFSNDVSGNNRIILSVILFAVALCYALVLNKTLKGDENEN